MDFCCEEDEHQFFDAQDNIVAFSESSSECPGRDDVSLSGEEIARWASSCSQFDFWVQNPRSVREWRSKFLNWLGLRANRVSFGYNSVCSSCSDVEVDIITKCNGAITRCSSFECKFSPGRYSMSSWSSNDSEYYGSAYMENFLSGTGNWVNGGEWIEDEFREDGRFGDKKEVDSDISGVIEQFEHPLESPPPSRKTSVASNPGSRTMRGSRKSDKKGWLKLCSFSCVMEEKERQSDGSDSRGARLQRVKVRQYSKKHRELSAALHLSQDFHAHEGSILVMKFSPDGHYLASAGEDRIVRVWKVVENERLNENDIPDTDPLSLYFTLNH